MIITGIEPCEKGKVKIFIDHAQPLQLYKGELKKLALQKDILDRPVSECQIQLDDELYRYIYYDIVGKRVTKRAMHLLERKDRTEEELRKKLMMGDYPPELVENAIAYVKSYHYIDDERYARTYVRLNQERKSMARIRHDLAARGISRDIIEVALEEENETEPEELIRRLMEKKQYDINQASLQDKQRMYRFLMSRGFSYHEIMHVL